MSGHGAGEMCFKFWGFWDVTIFCVSCIQSLYQLEHCIPKQRERERRGLNSDGDGWADGGMGGKPCYCNVISYLIIIKPLQENGLHV